MCIVKFNFDYFNHFEFAFTFSALPLKMYSSLVYLFGLIADKKFKWSTFFIQRWSYFYVLIFQRTLWKILMLQNIWYYKISLTMLKEFICGVNELTSIKSNHTITLPNFKKPFKTINKWNKLFLLTNFHNILKYCKSFAYISFVASVHLFSRSNKR